MEFARLVKEARERHFKTAKEFYLHAGFKFSYQRYAEFESGKLPYPGVDNAMQVALALKIPLKTALFAWVRDQVKDADVQGVLAPDPVEETPVYDDTFRPSAPSMSKAQLARIEKEPLYFDIILFLGARGGKPATVAEIASGVKIDAKRAGHLLTFLSDYGLVASAEDGTYALSSRHYSLPLERHLAPVRTTIMERAFAAFLPREADDRRIASTLTRELTPLQEEELRRRVASLLSWIDSLPASPEAKEKRTYTIGVFGSEREFGTPQERPARGSPKET